MAQDRLTRQEISWLLAQEARGAAKSLRAGVSHLGTPAPQLDDRARGNREFETTLDALDDAIQMLSELQTGPTLVRRGRIDVAALLYELAPNARLSVEPGEGTEVFGEEAELRRMVHVLINQTHSDPAGALESASPEVTIRREGSFVSISVELGPDTSATAEVERRWLSRMALRHGGRLEYRGGQQTIYLPANGASEQVAELKKELEQAQQLGEAYARELATAFGSAAFEESNAAPASKPSPEPQQLETLVGSATALVRPLREVYEGLRQDCEKLRSEMGRNSEALEGLSRRLATTGELLAEISAIAQCSLNEATERSCKVARLCQEVVQELDARADRARVKIELRVDDALEAALSPQSFKLLLASLLTHAIAATPPTQAVRIDAHHESGMLCIRVEDGGPSVPASARAKLFRNQVDPASLGRPSGLSLLVAHALAEHVGGQLSISEASSGRTELIAGLPTDRIGAA